MRLVIPRGWSVALLLSILATIVPHVNVPSSDAAPSEQSVNQSTKVLCNCDKCLGKRTHLSVAQAIERKQALSMRNDRIKLQDPIKLASFSTACWQQHNELQAAAHP